MSTLQGDDRLEEKGSEPSSPPARQAAKKPASARAGRSSGTRRKAPAKPVEEASPVEGEPTGGNGTGPLKPRLLEAYRSEVVPNMMKEFGYRNVMQVPHLQKVVLNIGLGEALTNPKAMESAARDLSIISGQKPVVTRAKKSVAGFKLREGNPIGMYVTLRGGKMYHFMDRLLNAALPRVRDFRGVSTSSFDGRGNYSLGIREQIIFPEIDYGQIERIRGFQVTITTTARTDGEATRLLALLGMPFAGQN